MSIESQDIFLELVSNYHSNPGKFIFFIGAGLSQPLFPAWGSLLKQFSTLIKKSDTNFDESEILKFIENGESYLDVAEACVDAMGPARYREVMENIFDIELKEENIPEGYKALMALAPKAIVTTNYDRIPDVAGKGLYRINTNKTAAEASRSLNAGKHFVFKMHGDINDHSSLVLTASDYQKIIHSNQSTQLLLKSLLSTKILIFIGFSLADPHLDYLMGNVQEINNGISLSHYVLLNENSKFKISAFKKKYGVKVISYTPSDGTHPEVVQLLRALNHGVSISAKPTKQEIDIPNAEELIVYVDKLIQEISIDSAFSVFLEKGELCISFSPIGQTISEIQKELISLVKLMNFNCSFIKTVQINIIHATPYSVNIDECQQMALKAIFNFSDAKRFARKEISIAVMWKLINFFAPGSLTNFLQSEEEVTFQMNTGIIGE